MEPWLYRHTGKRDRSVAVLHRERRHDRVPLADRCESACVSTWNGRESFVAVSRREVRRSGCERRVVRALRSQGEQIVASSPGVAGGMLDWAVIKPRPFFLV